MTSPVLQEQSGDGQWTMTFFLPSDYNLQNAPEPNDAKVQLVEEPAFHAATLHYSGNNSIDKVKKHEDKLHEVSYGQ